MVNTLGVYDPIFYANEALIQLEKSLGMANTVHRGFEVERNVSKKGKTIQVRRPSTFTAEDMPGTAQNLDTETVTMSLDYYRTVQFKVPDNEYAFTGQRLIDDHIRPAAVAIADDIDQKLAALYKDIPWLHDLNATPGSVVADVTGPRRIMFDNLVPLNPTSNMFYMVNGELEQGFLENAAFSQWNGAGPTGEATQVNGAMGMRYGLNHYANQNVQTHVGGGLTDGVGALTADASKGATSITVDGIDATGNIKAGDSLVIAGSSQRYAVTAEATAAGGVVSLSITPPLSQAYSDNDVVTITSTSASTGENLAYHRNAFGLVMAELPSEIIREAAGAKVETVFDPITGLSLRSRLWYDPKEAEIHVSLDALYAVKTFDPNLAVRARATVA